MLKNTATFVSSLAPLMVVTSQATKKISRRGRWLHVDLTAACVGIANQEVASAIETLLKAGAEVRVLEGNTIFQPVLKDGAVIWAHKTSHKTRRSATVKVALA